MKKLRKIVLRACWLMLAILGGALLADGDSWSVSQIFGALLMVIGSLVHSCKESPHD
jgi:hypothetical protein